MNRYLDWGDFVYSRKNFISDFNSVYSEFTKRFVSFCNEKLNIEEKVALDIANTLFNAMATDSRKYHSPIHILAIFDFATMNNISLEVWEELCIWFHDAIYFNNSSKFTNEYNSAVFMQCLMCNYVEPDILSSAFSGIIATEKHLQINVESCFDKILDLDICSFANSDIYESTAKLLREEMSDISDEEFESGRKKFIELLSSKGFIYRTDFFKQNFESIAMSNIRKTLNT